MSKAGIDGENIKKARENKGWSQKELADRLGVSQGAVSSWENGRVAPHALQISKLNEMLGEISASKAVPAPTASASPKPKQRAVKNDKSANNGVSGLLNQLFQAAVKLRGSIEATDYKRYVLPLVFLRFLSLRYEKRRDELLELLNDPASDYHGFDPEDLLNDPVEYRKANVFIVPEKARWDFLLKNAQSDQIKQLLDNALEELEKTYPDKLRGLLPRIFAGSNLTVESTAGLINLFSKDAFRDDHNGLDLIGRVYEYFIGEFADTEGKRGGEYFTPLSIVRTLVAMLEPEEGIVLDPCCGSGGMFVQADEYTKHSKKLSFVGQEAKEFTYRLCKMNLFIHGIDGNIQAGNSYTDDRLATAKADFLLANPPFNDGSKGEEGWGAHLIPDKDPRLKLGDGYMPLAAKNANTMWILHFLYHLKEGGTAGFVMATGELSTSEIARLEVRRNLVELDYVDCIVQLTGQLFANTQIPCSLWFLSKNRKGTHGYRKRTGEVLFIDGRKLGALILGSRKQKELAVEEIEKMAAVYRTFKREGRPEAIPGFCGVATLDEIKEHGYVLTPGRYVGSEDVEDDGEEFGDKMARLTATLEEQFAESARLETEIRKNLASLGFSVGVETR